MNDTPENIKELQLQIWLSKSPAERLKQAIEDNAALFKFWEALQKLNQASSNSNASSNYSTNNKT
jgi:hypothetical protein